MYVYMYSSVSYFFVHFLMAFLDNVQDWKGFSQDISAAYALTDRHTIY